MNTKTIMKKLVLLLTLSLPLLTTAQDKATIGINAGSTLSSIIVNDDASDYAFDFMLGVSCEVPLKNNFSLLANVNYERKTGKVMIEDIYNSNNEVTAKFRMHYITIPVNLKYYIGAKKNFFIHAGPYAGIFIDDTFIYDGKAQTNEISGGSDFKRMDFGITSGIGTRIPVSDRNSITLGLRSNIGLSNVSDMPDYNFKTNSFNFVFTWENIL